MRIRIILTAAVFGAALSETPAFGADESLGSGLVVRESGAVTYVSGGIGSAQQDALARAAGRFNLKLTMATSDGKFIGRADVRIVDGDGRALVAAASDGPLFLANVPAGTYRVEATAAGKSLQQEVTVPAQGQKQIVLTWPQAADEKPLQTSRHSGS
jgi:hypothetical protein